MKRPLLFLFCVSALSAAEYHVAITGADTNDGSAANPLKTIQAAAAVARPGDIVTVHAGTYRERVDPPRGGESADKRIIYQAAPGEDVVITGADPLKGWEKVANDTWKVVIPNAAFGVFNPFSHKIQGEWCEPTGRHAGSVFLNGEWLAESLALAPVQQPAGSTPLWFAEVGGTTKGDEQDLFAIRSFTLGGQRTDAVNFNRKNGAVHPDPDRKCIGWTRPGNWVAYDGIDLGKEQTIAVEAGALGDGGIIEFHAGLGTAEAEFLGSTVIARTGGWLSWQTFSAPVRASSFAGKKTLYLVFRAGEGQRIAGDNTTIWAQFPGVDPNVSNVEISKRQSVFYPSKTGIDFITVRGFEMCRAATPWGGAMSEQIGLIGTHWSRGWIIEGNHIHHSMGKGVALGRYELPAAELPPATAPGFVKSMELARRDGWSKARVGSHIVRNNHIHHCEKNAIHGSLGAAFSEISGNEIHDIARTGWVRGPDTGGIKFLGGVDMIIRDNHIHRCGQHAGIWLDWSCQGTHVTGNLLHDNSRDIFFEMQHGPLVAANNILLSRESLLVNSEGLALAHNLIAGATVNISDPRATPFHPAHAVDIAGLYTACAGDHRVHNNIIAGKWNIFGKLPNVASGNLFIGTAPPLPFDPAPAVMTGVDPLPELSQKAGGWYLVIGAKPTWRDAARCQLVTTSLLGKARIPDLPYENTDGTPLKIDTDYFGKPRDNTSPFPGPIESPANGEIKVWPK